MPPTAAATRSARCISSLTGRCSSGSATARTAVPDPLAPRPGPRTASTARSCASTRTARHRRTTRSTTARTPSGRRCGCTASATVPFRRQPGERRHLVRRRRLEHVGRGQPRRQGSATTAGRATRATAASGYQIALPVPAPPAGRRKLRRSSPTTTAVGTAVIGGPFYTGTLYPEQYQGNYFFADYTGNFIKRIVFDASDNPVGACSRSPRTCRRRCHSRSGPDGMIYYCRSRPVRSGASDTTARRGRRPATPKYGLLASRPWRSRARGPSTPAAGR